MPQVERRRISFAERLKSLAGERRDLEARALAVLIGVGVGAAGFAPLSNVADVLDVPEHPILLAFVPSVVLAALSCLAAFRLPYSPDGKSRGHDTLLVAAAIALLAGGCLSLIGSDAPRLSAQLFLVTLIAPMVVMWALLRADLPHSWLCAAFLAAVCLLMLRADVAFFADYGFPSGDDLFQAKFSNAPYDFHYYALKNPNQTAAFLLLPIGMAAFWAVGSIRSRWRFVLLSAVTVFLLLNLVMVYTRAAIAVGVIVVLAAILSLPASRRMRITAAAVLMALTLALVSLPSVRDYFLNAADTSSEDASAVVRFSSTLDGGQELIDHPLTGVGLGRYGNTPDQSPAHSVVFQAGAELGVLGTAGALAILAWLIRTVRRRIRLNGGLGGLEGGAAVGGLTYWLYIVGFGGLTLGVSTGYIAAWGMSLAVLGAVSTRNLPVSTAAVDASSRSASREFKRSVGAARLLRLVAPVLLVIPIVVALSGDAEEDLTAFSNFSAEKLSFSWSFSDGSNSDWKSFTPTETGPRGLIARVDASSQAYILVSDPVELTEGVYEVIGDLRLLRGAVAISVLDFESGKFITSNVLRADDERGKKGVTAEFGLTEPATTQIVLSNGFDGRSALEIEMIALRSDPDA